MCILDLISNSSSSNSKVESKLAFVNARGNSKVPGAEFSHYNSNFMLNFIRENDVLSSESSSSGNEDNLSSCTLCTSSFSFCNVSDM